MDEKTKVEVGMRSWRWRASGGGQRRRRWIEEIGFEARDPCVDKVGVEAMWLTDGKRKKLFGQSLEMASCSLQANVVNNLVTRTPEKRGCIFKGKSNIRLIYEELEGWYNTR